VTQEWHFNNLEFTLAKLCIELMIPQPLKHDSQMLFMFYRTLRIYEYVIDEGHDKPVQLQHEYGVHEVHEVCWHIGQSKRHDKILIQPVSHSESSLGDIFGTNFNLMVAGAEINLEEHLGSR
jgi:hypothetical protein